MSEKSSIMKDIMLQLAIRSVLDSVVNYNCSKLWFSFRYGGMMLEVDSDEETEKKYRFKKIGDFDTDEFCEKVIPSTKKPGLQSPGS